MLFCSTKEGHFQKSPDEATLRLFLEDMRNWEEVSNVYLLLF